MKTLIASFDDTNQAAEAVEALKAHSVPEDDVELVTNPCETPSKENRGPRGSKCKRFLMRLGADEETAEEFVSNVLRGGSILTVNVTNRCLDKVRELLFQHDAVRLLDARVLHK
jgi:hypothetical protein